MIGRCGNAEDEENMNEPLHVACFHCDATRPPFFETLFSCNHVRAIAFQLSFAIIVGGIDRQHPAAQDASNSDYRMGDGQGEFA